MTDRENDAPIPIPPTDSERHPTACRYCIVGCGYEVYKWPVGKEGGEEASQNALGIDYPAQVLQGQGITSNQHTIIEENGQQYHVVVKPDDENPVNNQSGSKGDHSIRGGTIANTLYGPDNQTDDRFTTPMIRIGNKLTPVDWDTAVKAFGIATRLATEDGQDPNGYGMNLYFYQFMENTYTGTKLCYDVIGSPNWGGHNRPTLTPENPSVVNAGLHEWTYAYEDTHEADTMFIVGASPYETQSIIFQEHIVEGVQNGANLVFVNPRRTFTANYAENNGGLFLQVNEATDAVLMNSIARHILDQGWEDTEFLNEWVMSDKDDIEGEGWFQKEFGLTPDGLRNHLDDSRYAPENAADITGVPAEDIREAAELIAKPKSDGERKRTTFLWEKGLIWGWSVENGAAMVNLPIITGSVGKPGAGVSRLGGHQEGFVMGGPAGDVISERSTQTFELSDGTEQTISPNVIERVKDGEIKHWHVVGCNQLRSTYNTQELRNEVRERIDGPQPQNASLDEIERAWRERIEQGGVIHTQQDIYPNEHTPMADIVLPAATWGERSDFHRWNGDRRLRHYAGFMEPPGSAKNDWEIFSLLGEEMGATDMDWEDSEEVFEEICSEVQTHGPHSLEGIHQKAQAEGKTCAEVMKELDTEGIRLPAKYEDGELVGTPRLHTPDEETPGEGRFYTGSGNAVLIRSDWDRVKDHYDQMKPDESAGELWITNGRLNRLWQSMYTHQRDPYILKRFPQNIVELNTEDAERLGIEAGDLVEVRNDDVYNMFGENGEGSFTAVAYVTEDPPQGEIVPQGTAFAYFLHYKQTNNDIVPAYLDPANPLPAYKYAKGQVRRIGESDLKDEMSFQARNVAP